MTTSFRSITKDRDLQALCSALDRCDPIAVDTETTSVDPMSAQLVGISLAVNEDIGFYIPLLHQSPGGDQLPTDHVLAILKPILQTKSIICHNAAYDILMFRRHGIELNIKFDTLLAPYSLGTPYGASNGLKQLVDSIFHTHLPSLEEIFGSKKGIDFRALPIQRATEYAAADALWTFRLYNFFQPKVQANTIFRIEMAALPSIVDMRYYGFCIDPAYAAKQANDLSGVYAFIIDQTYRLIARRLDISISDAQARWSLRSTKDVPNLLYDSLGLHCYKTTKAGGRSTDGNALAPHRGANPIVDNILSAREVERQIKIYFIEMPKLAHADNHIHSDVCQFGATSGRMASSSPNLQNIAKLNIWTIHCLAADGTESTQTFQANARNVFISSPGFRLLEVDYNQQELRILAGCSREPRLLAGYARNEDIHKLTASQLFHIPLQDVSPAQRQRGKTCNFALGFGMSAAGLYRQLAGEASVLEAEEARRAFFEAYPGLIQAQDYYRRISERTHTATTYFGRTQKIPEWDQTDAYSRSKALRAGIARYVQGTGADITKLALGRIRSILQQYPPSRVIMSLHDSIIYEVPDQQDFPLEEFCLAIRNAMAVPIPSYPIFETNFSLGTRWGELQENPFPSLRREIQFISIPPKVTKMAITTLQAECKAHSGYRSLVLTLGNDAIQLNLTSLTKEDAERILSADLLGSQSLQPIPQDWKIEEQQ